MYTSLRKRYRDLLFEIQEQLRERVATMAYDSRGGGSSTIYNTRNASGVGSASASPRSFARAAVAGGGGTGPQQMLKSSASTPSLRSRESEVVTMGRSGTPGNEGGNVRVVVRVRGFLPRGKLSLSSRLLILFQ